MAYVSAAYSKNWTYQKGGKDFDAKLGALLTNGAELQVPVCGAATHRQLQDARRSSCPHRPKGSGNVNDNPYRPAAAAAPWTGPRPGFSWVDQDGHPLAVGPPASAALLSATGASSTDSHSSAAPASSTTHSSARGNSYAGMTASQRSMALWEKVSPGMLPDTTKTPPATTAEAYRYEPHLLEPVDFTHHLKRTDFAEYTECALRHMHHLKAAAKK